MELLLQDLRYAMRAFRRAPTFTGAVLAALAGGSAAGVALLHLVDAGLSRPDGPPPPSGSGWSPAAESIAQAQDRGVDALLRTLGGGTLLVLAIACSTLAILLLARATARRAEMALRATLGAPRRRVLRQLLAEGGSLAVAGTLLGLLLAAAGIGLLRASWPEGLPAWLGFAAGVPAVALGLALPALATLGFVLAPARAATRRNLHGELVVGARATAGRHEGQLRNLLVIVAVAVSLVLLTGAGLLLRSFNAHEGAGGRGIDARDTLTMQLDLSGEQAPARAELFGRVLTRVGAVPGVQAESLSSTGAWTGLGVADRVTTICGACSRGMMLLPVVHGTARHHEVSPGFFKAHGVPLLRGREFASVDRPGAASTAVINETFAYRLFPNGEPMGKKIQVRGTWHTVVGIVRDVRTRGLGSGTEPVPAVYLSALQHPPRVAGLAVRTTGAPLEISPAVTAAVQTAGAPQLPQQIETMEQHLARFRAPLRWFAGIFAVLAGLAVLLAAHGLFGVITFTVQQRTREIGIRMALGAKARDVVGMIVRQSGRLVRLGLIPGLIGALSLARLLQFMFYGVRPLDPVVYGGVAALLAGVALFASVLPARRAVRVDPVVVLRAE